MKKSFALFSIAAIVFAAVSCNKEASIDVEITSDNERVVEFSTEPITKTVFGTLDGTTYPTLWTTNKNVALSLNYATARESTTPVLVSGGTSANFSAALIDDETSPKKILAVSPFTAIVSTSSFNEEYKSIKFKIESEQTPLENSVDEDDQVLVAFNNAGSTLPESVTMSFNHVAAYGRMSFVNLGLADGESVASVSMTSTLNWAGQFYYYFEDNTHGNNAGDITVSSGTKTINLTTTSTSDIWFACAPVAIGGTTVHVVITTNKGTTYSKDVAFPAGKAFQSGKVAKFAIDMNGIVADGAKVYTLVTDVSSLTLGSEVLIVSNSTEHAAGALGTNTYLAAYSITKSGSNINTPSASVEIFKIANGNIAGTYALQCTSDSDKYLTLTSGTSLEKNATLTDKGSWAITITGEGVASIRSMVETDRYILSNSGSSNRFSSYKPGSGYNDVSIYKDASTGSGAITAKTITGLEVSGMTTTFLKDDTFEFDGVVKLVYSDLSKETINSGYTIDASGVNMGVADDYTVHVTYDADPTNIKTSYDIAVIATSAYTWTLASGDLTSSGAYAASVSKGSPSRTWNLEYTWKTTASNPQWQAGKGVGIGTGNNPATSFVVSTSSFGSITITKVRVNASIAKSGSATLQVSVGGTPFERSSATSVSLTTTATDYTFTGSATGTIVITYTNSADKAIYLGAIGVNEE